MNGFHWRWFKPTELLIPAIVIVIVLASQEAMVPLMQPPEQPSLIPAAHAVYEQQLMQLDTDRNAAPAHGVCIEDVDDPRAAGVDRASSGDAAANSRRSIDVPPGAVRPMPEAGTPAHASD